MKKNIFIIATTLVMTLSSSALAQKIKVACVGNSITYGAGIVNREKNSYPAQLQSFLGDGYEVQNFGVNSSTLLSSGDLPYTTTGQYKQSLAYNPDIVIIKLGTNDSKPRNNGLLDANYKKEYSAFIDTYRQLPSKPRVVLLTPVRCYLPEDSFSTQSYLNTIIPALKELAFEKNCDIINLYSLFDPEWQEHLMPDKLHPSSLGAAMMAQKIGSYLTFPSDKPGVISSINYKIDETFNFHGYRGVKFRAMGADCMIVEPKNAANGNPWVWRARFWGHEPQTDIALLENGFHVVYCDVADLYGSPKAVDRWNRFYELVAMPAGLNKKVALEGMSRGGLIIYNWAVANPTRVACIYADAPVMDFKSWPMGNGSSDGSAVDSKQLLAAYGFADEDAAQKWTKNPLDHAKKLAKAGVPMLHVVGDADVVVPVAENTELFEKAVKKAGGNITVIHKPGIGHHPHSLAVPEPIVNFILQHTGQMRNYCVRPIAGSEYRSGAGWIQGSDWHTVSEEISAMLGQCKDLKVLFLGNSITQGFGGERKLVTYKPGKQYADSLFGNAWFPAGISGDRTQHLLWRVKNGNYEACNPKNVVITIGINNLNNGDAPEMVAEGIKAIADEVATRFNGSNIIVLGLLPAGATLDAQLRGKCDATHRQLAKMKWAENVSYVNPTMWFVDQTSGNLKEGLYSGDNLHLVGNGYKVWCEQLAKLMK